MTPQPQPQQRGRGLASRMFSRCDSCGTGTGWDVGPILMARGWQGFHIDGVKDDVPWEGAVWACPTCAPRVAAGTGPIRTFLGGFTTEPTMAEFVGEPAAAMTGKQESDA